MRKYLSTIALALLAAACSKEEVSTYDTELTALDIWVGTQAGAVYESETYNYSYAYEEGSVTFYAQICGVPVDYDRTFHLEAFGGDIDRMGNTVRTENYVIPAGQTGGTYKVYFNTQKLTDSTMFSDENGTINFRMVPNDDLAIGSEKHQQFTVVLKNYLAKPDNWDAVNFPQMALSRYFGSYSRVKYQFMIEHLGLRDFTVNYNATTAYNEETNTVSNSYATHLTQVMQRALNEYNASHETPLTDEFGIPVTF